MQFNKDVALSDENASGLIVYCEILNGLEESFPGISHPPDSVVNELVADLLAKNAESIEAQRKASV